MLRYFKYRFLDLYIAPESPICAVASLAWSLTVGLVQLAQLHLEYSTYVAYLYIYIYTHTLKYINQAHWPLQTADSKQEWSPHITKVQGLFKGYFSRHGVGVREDVFLFHGGCDCRGCNHQEQEHTITRHLQGIMAPEDGVGRPVKPVVEGGKGII